MPALLAYLLALTVLIGASYGGLHYVSDHDASGLTQGQKAKLANRKKFEREAATRLSADGDKADGPSARAPAERPKPLGPPDVTAATPGESADTAPAREVPKTAVVPPPRLANATSAETIAIPATALATATTMTPSPNTGVNVAGNADGLTAAPEPATSRPALTNLVVSPTADGAATLAAAEKRTRKIRRAPQRNKLVLMTLQTIQYADGRIAERLVPLQSRRQREPIERSSRSEWFDDSFD